MSSMIEQLEAPLPPLLEGYRLRILDGTCLAATDHRVKVLRPYAACALPGKCLVGLDPSFKLAVDVFPCEDEHAQERALFPQVLTTVQAGQLWMADRNMCTLGFLFGVQQRQAELVIRPHQSLTQQVVSELQAVGQVETR